MSNIVKRNGFMPSVSLFDDFTRDFLNWSGIYNEGRSVPQVNIIDNDDNFAIQLAAPGMKKQDFHLELDNDVLTIQADVQNSGEDELIYTRKEFNYHNFKRSFHLPNTVEADQIKASYRDGILNLTIPKKEAARKKPLKTIAIS